MAQRRDRVFYGWYVVGGASLALFVENGIISSFGAFATPLSQHFDASRASTSGLFAVMSCLALGLGIISGPIADQLGPRLLVLTGGLLIGAGLIVASRAETLWQVYGAYAVGVGVGAACIVVPVTEAVEHWFLRRRALATGLAASGVGAGTLIVPPLAAALLRDLSWRAVFLLFGIAAMIGIVAASRLIASSPMARGLRPDGDEESTLEPYDPEAGVTLREALATRRFWLLWAALLIGGFGSFVPFAHLIPDAESHGMHPVVASGMLSLIGAGGLLSRLLVGIAADRIGRRRSLVLASAGAAAFLCWWLAANHVWSCAAFAFGYGLTNGSLGTLVPALAVDYFGTRHAGAIIGVLFASWAPGSLIGPILAGLIFDAHGSYTLPILASAATMLIATACTLLLPDPEPEVAPVPVRLTGAAS
ncbi:MAG: MFS transporter [Dehalococcoidia bacterium]